MTDHRHSERSEESRPPGDGPGVRNASLTLSMTEWACPCGEHLLIAWPPGTGTDGFLVLEGLEE